MITAWLTPLFMTWGMFSAIPCPCKLWDDSRRGQMLPWLPVLGVLHGLIWFAVAAALCRLQVGLVGAGVLTVLPWLLSGGIHLDGYMDCCDAILSRRALEERRRILKDSHVGAFAVIGLVVLGILQFSAFGSIQTGQSLFPLLLIPCVVRCCAALAINALPPLPTSGYTGRGAAAKNKTNTAVEVAELIAAILLALLVSGRAGLAVPLAAAGSAAALAVCTKDLQGMSGDISGCAITVGELCGVLALALL